MIQFTKMNGLGNDYVYIDATKSDVENANELAIKVSERHFGVGSDGLVLIKKSDKADFFMEMYNADGSEAEMCGNAIRCVGKYVYDKGLTDKTVVEIDTLAGVKTLELTVVDNKVELVKVNMGEPILNPKDIVVVTDKDKFVNEEVVVDGIPYYMTAVSMGNPHTVVFMDEVSDLNLEWIGPAFENHEIFPNRVNTEFVKVIDRHNLEMRVWERGSGETLACGTGACAVLVASVLNGLCERTATVHLLGGKLQLHWSLEDNCVYKTGPATFSFEGSLY